MARHHSISIVGTGNVAWHLSQVFEKAGHTIIDVAGRDLAKAKEITANLYNGKPTTSMDLSESTASYFFLAVSDDSLSEIVKSCKFPSSSVVVHTSGSKGLEVLASLKQQTGVFYPLQTFTKGKKLNFEEVPVIIESPVVDVEKALTEIALTVCRNIYYLNSERRQKLHAAAVFASNFVNFMLTNSKEIMDKEQIPFEMLAALVKETVDKAMTEDPKAVQTGPAVRKDMNTINDHLKFLEQYPGSWKVYKDLTAEIIEKYNK